MVNSNSTISQKIFSIFKRDLFIFLSNLLTSSIIARNLGPNSLGIWTILSLISAYGEAFGRTKVDVASVFFVGTKKFKLKEILTNSNLITFLGFLLFFIFFFLFYDYIYSWIFQSVESNYLIEVLFIVIHLFLYFFYSNYLYYFLAIDRVNVYNNIVLLRTWTLTFLSISLILFTDLGIISLIIATIFSTFISLFYGVYESKSKMFYFEFVNYNLIKGMLKYSKNIYFSGILAQLQQSSVRLISSKFLTPSSIAFLGQGESITALINKLIDPINSIMYPEISRSDSTSSIYVTLQTFRLLTLVLAFASFSLYLFVNPLVLLIYGPTFLTISNVVYLLLPGLFVNSISSVFTNFFNGSGKANFIPKIMIFPLLFQIITSLFIIPKYGLLGCSFVMSFGFALNGVVTIIYFKKFTNSVLLDFIPKISDFKLLFKIIFRIIPFKF